MAAATLVADYLMPMSERVYGDAGAPLAERYAATIARWIIHTKAKGVHVRHLLREVRLPGLRDAATIREACDVLVEADWLRPADAPTCVTCVPCVTPITGPGGRSELSTCAAPSEPADTLDTLDTLAQEHSGLHCVTDISASDPEGAIDLLTAKLLSQTERNPAVRITPRRWTTSASAPRPATRKASPQPSRRSENAHPPSESFRWSPKSTAHGQAHASSSSSTNDPNPLETSRSEMATIQERKCQCWRKRVVCYFCVDCQKCRGDCRYDDGRAPDASRAPNPWAIDPKSAATTGQIVPGRPMLP